MKGPIAVAALAAMWGSALAAGAAAAPAMRARNLTTSNSAWVSTASQGMPLKQNVSLLGAMPSNANLHVVVGLTMPNRAAAQAYLQHITTAGDPLYGRYLAKGQFANTFAPTPAAASAVANYLASAGLTNVTVAANRLYVTADGSAATVSRAFNTSIDRYSINGATYFANATAAQVPAALAGFVNGVVGLSDLDKAHSNMQYSTGVSNGIPVRTASSGPPLATCQAIPPHGVHLNPAFFTQFGLPAPPVTGVDLPPSPVTAPVPVCVKASIGPIGYQTLYSALNQPTGQNTDLSIIVTGDTKPLAGDLAKFWGDYGITPTPLTTIYTDSGAASSTDLSGIGEFDMDTQYSTGMAGGLHHLYLYNGASLNSSAIDGAINQWVVDDKTAIASMSIGGCEFLNWALGDTAIEDSILFAGALQGQALFNSSGDEGSACAVLVNTGYPVGVQNVEYPSSDPYVVAVGGTSLIPNADVTYNTEFSWIGGGGGPSYVEAAPPWQFQNDVPSALAGRRGVPDIAYPADPELGGANVYNSGAYSGIGGTSLATPLAAGAWARILSAHGNALGYAPAEIYRAYRAASILTSISLPAFGTSTLVGGFNDIQFGSNGLYQATPAYDYNTGVGTINVAALNGLFDQIGR